MKHFLLSILLIIPCVIYAHKINRYKYLTIESQGNPYKIESKINNFFKGIGFKVISMDDFPSLSREEGELALIAKYSYDIVYDGESNVSLTLSNTRGDVVFTTKQFGISFTAKGDISKALNRIFHQIENLNYKFTPSTNKEASSALEMAKVDSVKSYINSHSTEFKNSVEGIYNSFNDDGSKYSIGIIENKSKSIYEAIVLETNQEYVNQGDVLFELTAFGNNQFVGEYKANNFYSGGRIMATLDGKALKLQIGKNGKQVTFIFVKE